MNSAIWCLTGVVVGAVLTWALRLLEARSIGAKADALRKLEAGREHARSALAIVRAAANESWHRKVNDGSFDIETADLRLDEAESEISLIPDGVLRPRLLDALNAVRYPRGLDLGHPADHQRDGLRRICEAIAAYIREETTPPHDEGLDKLGRAVNTHHAEIETSDGLVRRTAANEAIR